MYWFERFNIAFKDLYHMEFTIKIIYHTLFLILSPHICVLFDFKNYQNISKCIKIKLIIYEIVKVQKMFFKETTMYLKTM